MLKNIGKQSVESLESVLENKRKATVGRIYDTIRDAILTCAQKLTRVSLIYRTEPTT